MKMMFWKKISVLLQKEIKHILTVLVIISAGIEVYVMTGKNISTVYMNVYIHYTAGFLFFYTVLYLAFNVFTGSRSSALAVSSSAVMFSFLLRNTEVYDNANSRAGMFPIGILAGLVYIIWLLVRLLLSFRMSELVTVLLADLIMIIAFFNLGYFGSGSFTGRIIYISLFVLTASQINHKYPFAYFLLVMLFLFMIPIRKEPINWEPVVKVAVGVANKGREAARSLRYYFSDFGTGTAYQSGYSSFAKTGNSVVLTDRTEIKLKTKDNTGFTFTDEATGKRYRGKRVVYLTGGRAVDKNRIFDMLYSLYMHGVDKTDADLYIRNSKLNIGYVYLKTGDEIAPEGAIRLTNDNGIIEEGRKKRNHKKGYNIYAEYLDIDYGNPYLTYIIASPVEDADKALLSYEDMSLYANNILGIRFKEYFTGEEYLSWQGYKGYLEEDIDISQVSHRMKELAYDITKNCVSDYDKCNAIEAYLRQYTYSTTVESKVYGSTTDSEGMSKIADEFLFESGKGYCVHYACAMVMLLRLNGIPSRFNTGYRYAFPFERMEEYPVYGHNAHAWPSAYIKGFGWVSFEPTSAYTIAKDRTWHRQPAKIKGEEEILKEGEVYSLNNGTSPYPTPAVTGVEEFSKVTERNYGRMINTFKMLLIIGLGVIVVVIIMLLGPIFYRSLRYRISDQRGRIILDMEDIIFLIKGICDKAVYDRGVMSDYITLIPDKYREEYDKVYKIYYRLKYRSGNDMSGEEIVSKEEEIITRELRNKLYKEYKMKFLRIFYVKFKKAY